MLFSKVISFAQDSLVVKDTNNFLPTTVNIDSINKVAFDTAILTEQHKILYGQASYYSSKFEGRRTANGETFNHKKFTAACNVLPLGTWIEVINLKNNKSVIVKTNDRLHPKMHRVVDLTLAAAKKLDFVSSGLAKVKVIVLGKNYKPKAKK